MAYKSFYNNIVAQPFKIAYAKVDVFVGGIQLERLAAIFFGKLRALYNLQLVQFQAG